MRGGEARGLAGALVDDHHVALELAGAHAQEGDAVAVLRVHVGLDLEDESGERGVVGSDKGTRGHVPAVLVWVGISLRLRRRRSCGGLPV